MRTYHNAAAGLMESKKSRIEAISNRLDFLINEMNSKRKKAKGDSFDYSNSDDSCEDSSTSESES